MAKNKKSQNERRKDQREHHQMSLAESVEPTSFKVKKKKDKNAGVTFKSSAMDSKQTSKILKQARKQVEDIEQSGTSSSSGSSLFIKSHCDPSKSFSEEFPALGEAIEVKISKKDEQDLAPFIDPTPRKPGPTLGDLIARRTAEKQREVDEQTEAMKEEVRELSESAVEHFSIMAEFLANYRSGKIPANFKHIKVMRDYDLILDVLNPEAWTPAAVLAATRQFATASKPRANDFNFNILLPRVRDDIAQFKKLNPFLHAALRKAMWKPDVFVMSIVLPLCSDPSCTLREATIVSSVLAKSTFKADPGAQAIFHICQLIANGQPYNGTQSIFLRTLIGKKYALPYGVIDEISAYFVYFEKDNRKLPVLWHQSFLTYVQIYSKDIPSEQRMRLLEICKKHSHRQITPEIRKILQNAESRDIEDQPDLTMDF